MCQLCGDIVQHRPDREQDEARLIGIEFGHCFDPEEGVAFAVGVQLRHLRGNPIAHRFRASIGYDKTQFAQALASAPCAHHLHSFGWFGH